MIAQSDFYAMGIGPFSVNWQSGSRLNQQMSVSLPDFII